MSDPVRKLTGGDLRGAQGTPGLTRRTAFEGDGHWFGHGASGRQSSTESGRVVISRVGEGQLVFPVDGPDAS